MAQFTMVSDGRILSIGSFEDVTSLATQERAAGHRVCVHRTRPADLASLPQGRTPSFDTRGFAVRLRQAGRTDLLHCLDAEDAQAVLEEIRSRGVQAKIVRV